MSNNAENSYIGYTKNITNTSFFANGVWPGVYLVPAVDFKWIAIGY